MFWFLDFLKNSTSCKSILWIPSPVNKSLWLMLSGRVARSRLYQHAPLTLSGTVTDWWNKELRQNAIIFGAKRSYFRELISAESNQEAGLFFFPDDCYIFSSWPLRKGGPRQLQSKISQWLWLCFIHSNLLRLWHTCVAFLILVFFFPEGIPALSPSFPVFVEQRNWLLHTSWLRVAGNTFAEVLRSWSQQLSWFSVMPDFRIQIVLARRSRTWTLENRFA